jgi:hypothetical protein
MGGFALSIFPNCCEKAKSLNTDLGEDIPDLLLENTAIEERLMIADWVREILAHLPSKAGSVDTEARTYRIFLRKLERS